MFLRAHRPLAARSLLVVTLLGGCAAATISVLHPAAAASLVAQVESFVTCSSQFACVVGRNTSVGSGVIGISTSGSGVFGESPGAGIGVAGTSPVGTGVLGTSRQGIGVFGTSPATGIGVSGTSSQGMGVYAAGGTGIYATAIVGGAAVYAQTFGSSDAVVASTGTGAGVNAYSTFGPAVYAFSPDGSGLRAEINSGSFAVVGTSMNLQGNGADFEGGRFGIVGRARASGYPLVLTDSSYNNVFSVTGTGDTYVYGDLHVRGDTVPFVRTASGTTIAAYTSTSTSPTVEDTGTAQLTFGVATVALEPTFAATIERSTYRVFLTPDGDTRGLFVAAKTPRGFIVRETQAGRSSLAFDYRIVATSAGQAGRRMAVVASQTLNAEPKTPILPPTRPELRHPKVPGMPKIVSGGR